MLALSLVMAAVASINYQRGNITFMDSDYLGDIRLSMKAIALNIKRFQSFQYSKVH